MERDWVVEQLKKFEIILTTMRSFEFLIFVIRDASLGLFQNSSIATKINKTIQILSKFIRSNEPSSFQPFAVFPWPNALRKTLQYFVAFSDEN